MNSSISPGSCSAPSRLRSMKLGTCIALLEGDARFADGPLLPQSEEGGERCGDIGEGLARAKCDAHPAVEHHQRHFLSGVIGAAPRRIVAVVSSDDDEILLVAAREETGEPFIEGDECRGITGEVAAMTVEHVELDEIREDESVGAI